MLKHDGAMFYRAATYLTRLSAILDGLPKKQSAPLVAKVSGVQKEHMLGALGGLNGELTALNAKVASIKANAFAEALLSDRCSYKDASVFIKEIDNILKAELTLIPMFVMSDQEVRYYDPKEPLFGTKFANNFRTQGEFELDEAAKCLALARPTAAVFHLMRIMEIGIRALARCLNIPDPLKPAERNWGYILGEIKKGADLRWPTAAVRVGDGALFEQLHASLDAVRNPWRNATMHVEKKYTDDEAEHIFVAVKGFMKKLSDRCDENGEPKVSGS
jgi:hypothetical protein